MFSREWIDATTKTGSRRGEVVFYTNYVRLPPPGKETPTAATTDATSAVPTTSAAGTGCRGKRWCGVESFKAGVPATGATGVLRPLGGGDSG